MLKFKACSISKDITGVKVIVDNETTTVEVKSLTGCKGNGRELKFSLGQWVDLLDRITDI